MLFRSRGSTEPGSSPSALGGNCSRERLEARSDWYLGHSAHPSPALLLMLLLVSDSTRDPDKDAPSSPRRRREDPPGGDLLRRRRLFCGIGRQLIARTERVGIVIWPLGLVIRFSEIAQSRIYSIKTRHERRSPYGLQVRRPYNKIGRASCRDRVFAVV